MKRPCIMGLALLVMVALARPAGAEVDVSKAMADIAEKTKNSLAVLTYKATIETRTLDLSGQAICIEANGVFMTMAVDPSLRPETLKDFQLALPGPEGKKINAKLLGVDVATGIGFLQALEPYPWTAVEFAKKSGMATGQPVFSIGLFDDPARTPYLGMAYVSTTIRVPGEMIYVTGGNLCAPGSPVFNSAGKAVGIVERQMPLSFIQVSNPQGQTTQLPTSSRFETSFFMPVEEFGQVFTKIPTDGNVTRLPWLGINKFEVVTDTAAKVLLLDPASPGIIVLELVPKEPADAGGVKERDVITAMNKQKIERLANNDLTVQNFVGKLKRLPIGSTVTLTVLRPSDNKTYDCQVKVAPMPPTPNEAKASFNGLIGLAVRERVEPLDSFLIKGPLSDVKGMITIYVTKDGPAAKAGIAVGDIIISIDRKPTQTVEQFKEVVDDHIKKAPNVDMVVRKQQGNLPEEVSIKVPPIPATAPAPAPAPK